jgi:hypothetical protein
MTWDVVQRSFFEGVTSTAFFTTQIRGNKTVLICVGFAFIHSFREHIVGHTLRAFDIILVVSEMSLTLGNRFWPSNALFYIRGDFIEDRDLRRKVIARNAYRAMAVFLIFLTVFY